jgi:hypothetical protein
MRRDLLSDLKKPLDAMIKQKMELHHANNEISLPI